MRSINVHEHVNVASTVICGLLLVVSTIDPVLCKYNIYTVVHAFQIQFEKCLCGHKWSTYKRIV